MLEDGGDEHEDGLESVYPEPDPEADLPDPEADLPHVPAVEVPSPGTPEGDASPALLRDFWTTVLVFNVATLTISVGAMMLAFGVERRLGAALLAVGLLSVVRGYRKYRTLEARQASGEYDEAADDREGDDSAGERGDDTASERNG